MSLMNLDGFNSLKANKSLIENTTQKILNAHGSKRRTNLTKIAGAAASFLLIIGIISTYPLYKNILLGKSLSDTNITLGTAQEGGVKIPALALPKTTNGASMDMIGLIVYNGRIYTQTATKIDAESAKDLLGDKLGTTKGTIDEWSKQDEYAVEFASNIGKQDVYTVKGYNIDFRIMTYTSGNIYPEFYECLNGITVRSGKDIFGKLKIAGNVKSAQYRSYDDWNNGIQNFHSINNMELFNAFTEELDQAVPFSYDSLNSELYGYRNNENYRDVIIKLQDGSEVSMVLLKDGYIRYGFTNVYFKIDNEVISNLFNELDV